MSLKELLSKRLGFGKDRGFKKDDPYHLALVIEGGGMAGAVSGGMCLFLERSGYIKAFDSIYGCSAGALNGSYTSTGQAEEGLDNYRDMSERLLRFSRLFQGKPPLDLDYLFNYIIPKKRPLDISSQKIAFKSLVLSKESYSVLPRDDFSSAKDMISLVRASCTMPILAGGPFFYKNEPLFDGGLIESIPFQSAIDSGATHVLALRSQGKDYRKKDYHPGFTKILKSYDPVLAQMFSERPKRYNKEADLLSQTKTSLEKRCDQIAIYSDISKGSFSLNPSREEIENWISSGEEAAFMYFDKLKCAQQGYIFS